MPPAPLERPGGVAQGGVLHGHTENYRHCGGVGRFGHLTRLQQGCREPLPICRGCGVALTPEPDRKRRRGAYCPGCLARRRREVGVSLPELSAAHGVEFRQQTGDRSTHSADASARRKESNTDQRAEQEQWARVHRGPTHDPEWFTARILPRLTAVTLTRSAHATGMSTSAASKVRAGRRVPHPRHWQALVELVGIDRKCTE
jgi:hypothetical protein